MQFSRCSETDKQNVKCWLHFPSTCIRPIRILQSELQGEIVTCINIHIHIYKQAHEHKQTYIHVNIYKNVENLKCLSTYFR